MHTPICCDQELRHSDLESPVTPPPSPLGRHLIADFFGAEHLQDPDFIEQAMVNAALAAGARVLGSHIHTFGEGMGVTGVITLAESHISIHSWPEHGYAAIDVFMCGEADPMIALRLLVEALHPSKTSVRVHPRGESIE
jgi:S-adenosylmethionine decarboxylase